MLSATAEYALRAVVHLAGRGEDVPVRAGDLAEAVSVPPNYMAKILHELVKAGILRSTRGKHGGFQLAVPPTKLPLLRVVSIFDEMGKRKRCLLGRTECTDRNPCAAHQQWKATAEEIARFFRETTVADVLA